MKSLILLDVSSYLSDFTSSLGGGKYTTFLVALAILIVGYFIAKFISKLVSKALAKTTLDNKLLSNVSVKPEVFVGKLVYYLIMIMVIIAVLEKAGLTGVLDPLNNMVGKVTDFLPNILGAGIIGFVGYILAKILSEAVGMGSEVIEGYTNKLGVKSGSINVVKILKQIVFVIIFIPLLVKALDILNIDTISAPAKELIGTFWDAIPKIFLAAIIIAVFFYLGRFLRDFIYDLLKNLGVDSYAEKLGISGITGDTSLSKLICNLGFFFLMFLGIIQAVEALGFGQLHGTLNNLLALSSKIFLGILVLGIGNFISTLAFKALAKGDDDTFLANIARVATLGLFLAIALNTMGIGQEIVNLAFGLTLGAVAVAVALAFGLGGRKAAGKQAEYILRKFRKGEDIID